MDISQGSVAKLLRCDGLCNDHFNADWLLDVPVKEL